MKLFTKKGWSKKFVYNKLKPVLVESKCIQCGDPAFSVRKVKYCKRCTNGGPSYAYYRDGKKYG